MPPDLPQLVNLSQQIGQQLRAQERTLALAESCTGGLVSSLITDVPGSSAYLLGAVVSYSNEAKIQLLGVPAALIESAGAVSAEVAAAMAQGARRLFGSDIALAITGIAGPGGGTADKPVGLVYLHLSAGDSERGERHVWPFDRYGNKLASAQAVLQLLQRYLAEKAQPAGRPLVVEARYRGQRWQPEAVWWQGQRWPITGHGRYQATETGAIMLVEIANGARMELAVDTGAGVWRLLRLWEAPRVV